MISVFPKLDPLLFDYRGGEAQPILNPLVQKQIQMGLGEVSRAVPVRWCVLTGDALRTSYRDSQLKVIIGIKDSDIDSQRCKYMITALQSIIDRLNNDSRALGTQHPIKYIVTTKLYSDIKFRDAYALLDDRWLKSSYTPLQEKIQVKRPTSRRQYMQSIFRGLERKNPNYIPDIYQSKNTEITHSKIPFEAAKQSSNGIWRISRYQALEIAKHFHLTHLPKRPKPFKMLGNTHIMMFRPKSDLFFLIKGTYAKKIRNALRHISYA